ncbi:RNA guanine-N7 methyltransferase activating subunit [Taenia solium]|eukprot:TsM_000730600 transcript=TsM_000730600 gene=TsM_000730600
MSELPTEAEYEERFKSRFSIDDEEFTAYVNEPSPSPPIFERWISRSPRPQPSASRRNFHKSRYSCRNDEQPHRTD